MNLSPGPSYEIVRLRSRGVGEKRMGRSSIVCCQDRGALWFSLQLFIFVLRHVQVTPS